MDLADLVPQHRRDLSGRDLGHRPGGSDPLCEPGDRPDPPRPGRGARRSLSVFDTLDEPGRRSSPRTSTRSARPAGSTSTDVEVQWVRSDGTTTWTLCGRAALLDGRARSGLSSTGTRTTRSGASWSSPCASTRTRSPTRSARSSSCRRSPARPTRRRRWATCCVHARDLVLLHDDWERARAFVPESPESTTLVPSTPWTRTGRRTRTTRSRRPSSRSPRGARTRGDVDLGRAPAHPGVPGPARRRGLRGHRDHLGPAAVPVRADRADGRPGRRSSSPGWPSGSAPRPSWRRRATRRWRRPGSSRSSWPR